MFLRLKLTAKAAIVVASLAAPGWEASQRPSLAPETVAVAAMTFAYRMAGDFQKDGKTVDAPRVRTSTPAFGIMKYQLSNAEYDACAAERACPPRAKSRSRDPKLPAVLLSYEDARAYAAWLSAKTGETWRLPTDAEWRAAAGSRARDDALGLSGDDDPAQRWLAKYDAENRETDERLRPIGAFGANERGLYDLSGNVWEWTDDCFVRYAVDRSGVRPLISNCGVRVVEGEHRTYITDFIRDARAGGCSVGKPPSYLGVRLVREARPAPTARWRAFLTESSTWL